MKLKTLLWLQIVYFVLAQAFNVANLCLTILGISPISTPQILIVLGIISFVVYALFLIPGYLRKILLYRILIGIFTLITIWAAVTNTINIFTQPPNFSSYAARSVAMGINLYGLVVNGIAVLGKFKT